MNTATIAPTCNPAASIAHKLALAQRRAAAETHNETFTEWVKRDGDLHMVTVYPRQGARMFDGVTLFGRGEQ